MPRSQSLRNALRLQLGRQDALRELGWMRAHAQKSGDAVSTLRDLLRRRVAGEPLQYILGTQPFGALDLLVRAPVLIPRPETEDWTLRLAELLRMRLDHHNVQELNVLDICTGTGCIPLLLASVLSEPADLPPRIRALGVDINPRAVDLATENARRCGLSDLVSFAQRDLFAANFPDSTSERVDVLTANPPYIRPTQYAALPRSVLAFEDKAALLAADDDGLCFYPRIASLLPRLMKPGGVAAVEVGKGQADAVREIFESQSDGVVDRTEVWNDPWDIPRTVVAFLR